MRPMAKWLKDYLSFGSRRMPPQPPKPDYTESEILKAYRAQKELDFEDPYQSSESRLEKVSFGLDVSSAPLGTVLYNGLEVKVVSPKHRLIKVDSQDFGRCAAPLSGVPLSPVPSEEPSAPPVAPSAPVVGDSDTDYSDPFDARPPPRPRPERPVPPESSSYMEPFEAQRVIKELQQGSSERAREHPRARLYDSPYEEDRESRLPQEDERPADEYDQPWEWKKEDISKALAVQFDGADWERPLPQTEARLPLSCPTAAGGFCSLRKPTAPPPVLGERVDPTLTLEQQVWYHSAVTRAEAEALLSLCKECSYLVRNSQTSRDDFSLSLRSCKGFMHMKFTLSVDGKYVLGENSPPFSTIPEAIHYYTTHKLPIRGAEHLSLLFPVLVQTL